MYDPAQSAAKDSIINWTTQNFSGDDMKHTISRAFCKSLICGLEVSGNRSSFPKQHCRLEVSGNRSSFPKQHCRIEVSGNRSSFPKQHCRLGMTIVSLLLAHSSMAQESWMIPNLFISSRTFEYSVFNGNVRGHINSLGGGVTGIYQHFYLDLYGERNISTNEESIINGLQNTIEFERTDIAASIGYAVNDSISTFVGYKYGRSTLTELAFSPFAGAKTSLEGQGPFIGAGGGWKVKDWGTVSFSAAYAKMVTLYDSYTFGTTEGDASGTSLRLKWKAPLTNNLYYDLSLIRHDYYYENFSKLESDISEQILSLRLGISYRF